MIGIDTTFLVQLELKDLPLHLSAHQLLRSEVIESQTAVALSPQILTEFIHVVTGL